jgi:hypothetical protein
MSEAFYSHARLYDLMFPGGGPAVDFYRAGANRQGGRVHRHPLAPPTTPNHRNALARPAGYRWAA